MFAKVQPAHELPAPEQEPMAVIKRNEAGQITMQAPDGNPFDMSKYIGAKLHTAPPEQERREWQGLTDEEISAISKSIPGETDLWAGKRLFARAIETKLKEKNT
jgi:hypothetical protein